MRQVWRTVSVSKYEKKGSLEFLFQTIRKEGLAKRAGAAGVADDSRVKIGTKEA